MPNPPNEDILALADAQYQIDRSPTDGMQEDLAWRLGWAISYSGSNLYADDGELQDNSAIPYIDWLRDSASEITKKIAARAIIGASSKETSVRLKQAQINWHKNEIQRLTQEIVGNPRQCVSVGPKLDSTTYVGALGKT